MRVDVHGHGDLAATEVVAALAIGGALYLLVDSLRNHSWSALRWLFLLGFAAYAILNRMRNRPRGKR